MPFLHGFRRIIYEYQPLVDAVMRVVGIEEEEGGNENSAEEESSRCSSLVELLEQEAQSEVFLEGISYALFKVAERGLVHAAKTLLRYGADINFEDPVSYYNPLHIAVLRNRPNMVRLLVGHGADIEKRDRIHECSPLDFASEESERLPCLITLLELGADVNARDNHGKSPLLHALASSDGLTVHNTENIRLFSREEKIETAIRVRLRQSYKSLKKQKTIASAAVSPDYSQASSLFKSSRIRRKVWVQFRLRAAHPRADINAATVEGETVASSLVFLVKEALEASPEDASEIGQFCLQTTQLLLSHGMDPSCCLNEDGEPSLTQTSLEHFDLLFPLAVLLIQSGASLVCSRHSSSCWSGYSLLFQRLQTALRQCTDQSYAAELLEQAEMLLDLARVNVPRLNLPQRQGLPVDSLDSHPYAQALIDLHNRVVEREGSPPPLCCLSRAFIRSYLQPWPLVDRVKALPLPDRLKDFLLPELTYTPKAGWGCFKPQQSQG